MPNCKSCGQRLDMMDDELGRCLDFANANKSVSDANIAADTGSRQRHAEANLERIQANRSWEKQKIAAINAILLTTETASNLNITKRIEIVTAKCSFGMNMFKDLFSGVRNVVGGRSEAVQKTMRESRRTARVRISAFRRVRIHVEGSINQKVRMRDHD